LDGHVKESPKVEKYLDEGSGTTQGGLDRTPRSLKCFRWPPIAVTRQERHSEPWESIKSASGGRVRSCDAELPGRPDAIRDCLKVDLCRQRIAQIL